MAGRMRASTFKRWQEHLAACFSRGVRDFRDGIEFDDCPYQGKGVDTQRKSQWETGYRAAEKKSQKIL